MKHIHKLAAAAVLAFSSAGLASATTYHVTGSTAYRVADVSAEVQICGGTSAYATYYGSSLTGASYSVVQNAATSPTIKFENYFNGSIAGDEALVDGVTTLPFPAATTSTGSLTDTPTAVTTAPSAPSTVASGGRGLSAPTNNATLAPYTDIEQVAPDLAFSDVSFDTADQIILASTDHTTRQPVNSAIVGIVPFVFVANGSTDVYSELSGLSIDPQKFTFIWSSGGSATLSYLTGNNTALDTNAVIYPFGRDVDSGTRASALAETGYFLQGSGVITTPVAQFYPYASTAASGSNTLTGVIGVDTTLTSPTIAALNAVPAETIDGYAMPLADGGYYSGGNLSTGLSTAFAPGTTETVVVGYLGVSDAKSAITASGTNRVAGVLLGYNGVTFNPNPSTVSPTSANSELIEQGKYTFWGYEHLNANSTGAGILSSFTTALTTNGLDQLSSAGVTYSAMAVSRSDDGQNVQ